MPKGLLRSPKTGPIWHQSAEETTLVKKLRHNSFAYGRKVHESTKEKRI